LFTQNDLIDCIIGHLADNSLDKRPSLPASPNKPGRWVSPEIAKGRLFLSEYDIRRRLTAGQTRLTIPKEAIVSPLAVDWLILKGITVARE
jgi:hypothetical protein